jgi:hypothetical protein
MTIQDDTHDKLTKAYMAYFNANEKFAERRSLATKVAARKALAEIRILARLRRKELEDQYKVTRIQKQQERKNNNETGNN